MKKQVAKLRNLDIYHVLCPHCGEAQPEPRTDGIVSYNWKQGIIPYYKMLEQTGNLVAICKHCDKEYSLPELKNE